MDYRKIVKKVVMRFGHDKTREDREDFEQECEIVILEEKEKIDKLDEESQEKYIYFICKNRLINLLKKSKTTLSLSTEEVLWKAENTGQKVQNMDEVLDGEAVTENLNKLPEPYSTILALRFGIDCDPRTQDQIAARFCKSQRWVQKMEKTAIERLRELMKCK